MRHHIDRTLFLMSAMVMSLSISCEKISKNAPDKKVDEAKGSPSTGLAGNDDEIPKGFLTASDLKKPRNIKPIDKDELLEKLNDESFLFLAQDEDHKKSDNEESNCLESVFLGTPFKAQKNWLVQDIKKDVAKCFSSENAVYDKAILQTFLTMTVAHPEFKASDYDGKFLKDFESQSESRHDEDHDASLIKKLSEIRITASAKDPSGRLAQVTSTSSERTPDGRPCEMKGASVIACQKISVVQTTADSKDTADYKFFLKKDLKGEDNDPHYSSGTVEFVVNNWSGTITYKGKDIAPTWTAKSGSEKASGTLEKSEK